MIDEYEEIVEQRVVTVDQVRKAVNAVVVASGRDTVEGLEPGCAWPKVCGGKGCRFPRYSRNGQPTGIVAKTLIRLGYPLQLLLELDREHEVGEVLHPGVKLRRSRNAALARIDEKGMALLDFFQEHQKVGASWGELSVLAFGPRWTPKLMDRRKRPWLY